MFVCFSLKRLSLTKKKHIQALVVEAVCCPARNSSVSKPATSSFVKGHPSLDSFGLFPNPMAYPRNGTGEKMYGGHFFMAGRGARRLKARQSSRLGHVSRCWRLLLVTYPTDCPSTGCLQETQHYHHDPAAADIHPLCTWCF